MPPQGSLIAIVDDEAPIRRALVRLARSEGLQAMAFASGQEFLDSMPMDQLRCVVLDLHMPAMGGIEVRERLSHSWPEVPVIFITGREDGDAQRRALAAHPLAFLHKPIDDKLLLDAIARAAQEAGNRP
jgi:two-component system, LuxR family, response regulator FixJ